MQTKSQVPYIRQSRFQYAIRQIKKHWRFYVIILIPLILLLVFSYAPMYGLIIAFKRYNPVRGIVNSPWVGLKYFKQFFATPNWWPMVRNTLVLSLYQLLVGFPIPILLAIGINECRSKRYKKLVQMVTYAPHFISTVVLVGIILQMTDMRLGIANKIIVMLGGEASNIMGKASVFPHMYVWSGVWQSAGYSSILYIATLAGVSPELHEAAMVDGASRLRRIWHIDLPALRATVVLQLIVKMGQLLTIGHEKVFLMQNSLNLETSEIISTYVYKVGLQQANYSYSTAIGLMNTLVSFVLVVTANYVCKKLTETSMW